MLSDKAVVFSFNPESNLNEVIPTFGIDQPQVYIDQVHSIDQPPISDFNRTEASLASDLYNGTQISKDHQEPMLIQ